ncbi:hypothetical protein GCM10010345_91950 [Streptomyces canarius]|uniref:Uncharacterized protein n=1 Tax=Streptomyces canarius TaxID=285453 RepID=A0ABQ3DBB1_9ACTN|nr:hypothetical protein GCM10010345_91950 [Streptomyces canarius]
MGSRHVGDLVVRLSPDLDAPRHIHLGGGALRQFGDETGLRGGADIDNAVHRRQWGTGGKEGHAWLRPHTQASRQGSGEVRDVLKPSPCGDIRHVTCLHGRDCNSQ